MNLTGRPPLGLKQPKNKKNKKSREYLERVKSLHCVICAHPPPNDAHHVICDRFGTSKVSDYLTIPLCKDHHQNGPDAIHNGKKSWVEKFGPDHSYLYVVKKQLGE